MEELKPGDVVMLKSGGPRMTITSIDGKAPARTVYVSWFHAADSKSDSFAEAALERAARQ